MALRFDVVDILEAMDWEPHDPDLGSFLVAHLLIKDPFLESARLTLPSYSRHELILEQAQLPYKVPSFRQLVAKLEAVREAGLFEMVDRDSLLERDWVQNQGSGALLTVQGIEVLSLDLKTILEFPMLR